MASRSRMVTGVAAAGVMWTAPAAAADELELFGIPVAFVLFALTLLGVALFHHHTLKVGLLGLFAIVLYKLAFTTFDGVAGLPGLVHHLQHEWVVLSNLLLLLVGFSLLSNQFERSHIPEILPAILPDDWRGGLALLLLVFLMSGFLDNIAAAIIGGTIAHSVYRGRVHVGYLAALVAASNAGGAGSVIGDTTTTMMWIEGISPFDVVIAYLPAFVAFAVFSIPAALTQQRHSPIIKDRPSGLQVDWSRAMIVVIVLAAAIGTNVLVNVRFAAYADRFPFIGIALVAALLLTAWWRSPEWKLVPNAAKGSLFLLSLVTCASMMPVESLPAASWGTTLGLGFVSAVFDNIPLAKLALEQGGYDWGFLAFAVGFGGSMVWFGSSAGVALSTHFPQAKSVFAWLRHGWYVPLGFVLGYFAMLGLVGWRPS